MQRSCGIGDDRRFVLISTSSPLSCGYLDGVVVDKCRREGKDGLTESVIKFGRKLGMDAQVSI